jgi:uncharacterized membrane protein YdbT with pleckstrin-like domain
VNEEQVLYDTSPSMFRNRPILFLFGLITVVGIILILLPWWLMASNIRLTVTNERVTFKTGILAKKIREIFLSDIRSIEINQTFQQRIFNTGKVEISSAAATADAEISISGIPNPYEVKRLIDEYRRKNLSALD